MELCKIASRWNKGQAKQAFIARQKKRYKSKNQNVRERHPFNQLYPSFFYLVIDCLDNILSDYLK